MPKKLSVLLLGISVTLFSAANASDPAPMWNFKWSAHVWNTYCELRLEYAMPFKEDPERRGLLAGRAIDRLFASFAASTSTHYGLIPEDLLSKTRFHLAFYGEDGNHVPEDDRILSVKVGEFQMSLLTDQNAWIQSFGLDEDDASSLLQVFSGNQKVEVVVLFADGEERRSTIYPSGDKDFHVWAAMFKTCIRESVD